MFAEQGRSAGKADIGTASEAVLLTALEVLQKQSALRPEMQSFLQK